MTHNLKLAFGFDMGRLSLALSAIAGCLSHPQLSVAFTVKDATAINEAMLRSAAANAKKKAEILCEASDVTMGDLIAIDYNWGAVSYTHLVCRENNERMLSMDRPQYVNWIVREDGVVFEDQQPLNCYRLSYVRDRCV